MCAARIPANEDDEMKVQQIGLVLGMNVVAACLMMQGCKATKPGVGGPGYKPAEPVVVVDQPPPPPPARSSVVKVTEVPPELPPPSAPKAPVVKPVPPVADKPVVAPVPKRPVPAVAAAGEVYVVQKGDSLSKISKRFNVKLNAIVAANPGIKPDRIRIGQKVKIPGAAPAASAVAAAPSAPAAKKAPAAMPASASAANLTPPPVKTSSVKPYTGATKKYVVKAGDTLSGIAHDSGISVCALKELNGLERDTVRIGQELKIPAEKQVAAAKKADGAKAAAKKAPAADKSAAAKKDAAAAKPADAKEDVSAAAAPVGADSVAEAPSAAPAAAADSAAEAPAAAPKSDEAKADVEADAAAPVDTPVSGRTHVVKEGEDLVSIAIEHTVSPTSLIEVNNLKVTDGVKPGQVLRLPANAK